MFLKTTENLEVRFKTFFLNLYVIVVTTIILRVGNAANISVNSR